MADKQDDSEPAERSGRDVEAILELMGRRIRTVREARGLGLVEAAKAAGIGKGFLWRIEAGQQNVSMTTLARVAGALRATPAELLDGVPAVDRKGD